MPERNDPRETNPKLVEGAPYRDRADAGRRLAERLNAYRGEPTTVLGLPRGGVPLAAIIAERLGAPLDILVVRKVGAPGNPEFGLGAVAEGGVRYLDQKLARRFGLRPEDLEEQVRVLTGEVDRLGRRLRGGRAPAALEGRAVILVDDGMATGGTLRAAVEVARLHRPGRLVVAVGVSSPPAVESLRAHVDEVVCPLVPSSLVSVGEWYREFPQVSEWEVVTLLRKNWSRSPVEVAGAQGPGPFGVT